jgi:hypothetical protein
VRRPQQPFQLAALAQFLVAAERGDHLLTDLRAVAPALDDLEIGASAGLSPRLPTRLRRHRLEAPRLALPIRPLAGLDQGEELGVAGSAARGRGGVGTIEAKAMSRRFPLPWQVIEASRSRTFAGALLAMTLKTDLNDGNVPV